MLKKNQLENLLSYAMKSEADFAEIFEEDTDHEGISMLNEDVEDINRSVVAGAGIRLYKNQESVYAYTNDLSEDSLYALIDDLREALGAKSDGPAVHLEEVVIENAHPIEIDPFSTPLEEEVDLIVRASKSAKEVDEKIVKTQGSLASTRQYVQIANSNGRLVRDVRRRSRLVLHAFASDGTRMKNGQDSPGASKGLEYFMKERTPESIGKEAARLALVLLDAKPAPSGSMPVIIDNGFGGVIFHEACGHSLEATGVAKNQSVFAGKKGQKIANEKVSAVDDGTIANAWGSQNVDDEGNPQRLRVLIKDGILNEYMVDQLNGRRMKEASSGSGRRQSYKYEPTSRMSNTFILPGKDKKEDMFKGIKRGLYAKRMGGGSVNPNTGEFNFGVLEGYLIEDGKITDPVEGAMLIGSGAEILQKIDMVADNLERAQGMCGSISGSIPTDVGQPTIRVSSITVGGTANE
ncbi:TldD/PmbA family protein [Ileibacterium valens]|uniref:TldD/PmbA family protein n=1 Tax=Ileibacterium valens TaxID=1862668 RepID=UPI00259BAC97|nr:TldD/PmbA family protein [Ileibacterium valens]